MITFKNLVVISPEAAFDYVQKNNRFFDGLTKDDLIKIIPDLLVDPNESTDDVLSKCNKVQLLDYIKGKVTLADLQKIRAKLDVKNTRRDFLVERFSVILKTDPDRVYQGIVNYFNN